MSWVRVPHRPLSFAFFNAAMPRLHPKRESPPETLFRGVAFWAVTHCVTKKAQLYAWLTSLCGLPRGSHWHSPTSRLVPRSARIFVACRLVPRSARLFVACRLVPRSARLFVACRLVPRSARLFVASLLVESPIAHYLSLWIFEISSSIWVVFLSIKPLMELFPM